MAESRRAYAHIHPADYLADIMPGEKIALWDARLSDPVDPQTLSVSVADGGSEIAGFVSFVFDPSNPLGTYLHNLYVARGHQRRGIARALIAEGIDQLAPDQRQRPIYLQVFQDNAPAQAVYDRLGGTIIETYARNGDAAVMACRYQWPSADQLREAALRSPR